MTTPSTAEEVECQHQIHVDPSTYCLTKVGRNALPDVDVVVIPGPTDCAPSKTLYRLVFPLSASVSGYIEETSRGRIMRLFNGMCLGSIMGRNAAAAERDKENYKPDTHVLQCPRCGTGRFVVKSEEFGTGKWKTDSTGYERTCDKCGLSASFELDRTHGSLFAKFGDDTTVDNTAFSNTPVTSSEVVKRHRGLGIVTVETRCCDCGRERRCIANEQDFERGQYTFGCACGASAVAYFDAHGAVKVDWESPKRPECPVPQNLLGYFDKLSEAERKGVEVSGMALARNVETVRDLGASYFNMMKLSVSSWRSQAARWDQENNPDSF